MSKDNKDEVKDDFSRFEKGQTFYIHNGAWGGIIVQDDKDGKFYSTIGDGFGVRNLENKRNIDDLFGEGDSITKGKLTEKRYNDEMVEKGIAIRGNEGDLVSSEGEIYFVDEDYLVISVDKKYKEGIPVTLRNEKGVIKKPYHTLQNKESYDFSGVVKRYLTEESKRFYAKSLVSINKELKRKVNNLELEDVINSCNFGEYIKGYILKNKISEPGFAEDGVYVRGDYKITGKQMKYLYVLDKGLVKIQKYHTEDEETKQEIICGYDDMKKGIRLNILNRGRVSVFECLENLARTDYFFSEDKEYKKDYKFSQSRY